MRTIVTTFLSVCLLAGSACAQTDKDATKDKEGRPTPLPAGYMGLWDMGFGAGYMHFTEHHTYNATDFENQTTNGMFVVAHIQESVLCNYLWAKESDTKIKFGFTETLDVGGSYLDNKKLNTSNTAGSDTTIVHRKNYFWYLFTYEAGLAGVYKISDIMDAGLTVYPFVLSSFTPNHHYVKFRFRYSHLMCEVSAIGKNAIDIKYLKGTRTQGKHDRTSSIYYGISFVPHMDNSENNNSAPTFVYVNMGYVF